MTLSSRLPNAVASVFKFLNYLGIAVDLNIVKDELERHPDFPTLFAVTEVLSGLQIENEACRVSYEDLTQLECPFLAFMNSNGGELHVVSQVTPDSFFISSERWNKHKFSAEKFKQEYSGVVLIAGRATHSAGIKQQTYTRHRLRYTSTIFLTAVFVALLLTGAWTADLLDWRLVLPIILKTVGLAVTLLLLVQSVDRKNPFVQQLCSGEKLNCIAILTSGASQITRDLSWSELGFYYFTASWMALLFGHHSPQMLFLLAVLNICCLPYTFYSIYYQKYIAGQWCTLCCSVQLIFWLEFIPLHVFLQPALLSSATGWTEALRVLLVFTLLPFLGWRYLKPVFLKVQQLQPVKEQLRKFKYNVEVFQQMLKAQPKHPHPDPDWSVVIGNSAAPHVITMVSNPYCPPCAEAHAFLDDLVRTNSLVQARIIFNAKNDEGDVLAPVTRHLMALNDLPDKTIVGRALHDWYGQQQKDFKSWAEAHPVELRASAFYKLDKQHEWCQAAGLEATPTLYINGHRLPEQYFLPDLKYMLQ